MDASIGTVLRPAKVAELESYAANGKPLNGTGRPKVEPLVLTLDQIEEESVSWLWANRIPIGKLTLIDGDPGAGKSFLCLAIAAAVSRGQSLPDSKISSASNVLILAVEDGAADTIKPRLRTLGAEMTRIAVPNPGRGLAPTLMNPESIEQMVREVGPFLVVVDPIIAFAGKRDTDRAAQVREMLSPLMAIAQKYSLAMLLVRHLNKGSSKALYRGQGSIDFVAACRGAFIVGEDSEEPGRRIMAHVKNSLGPLTPSLSFYIDEGPKFRWGEKVSIDAEDILNQAPDRRGKGLLEEAKAFLKKALANGPLPANKVTADAESTKIARRTLWRAKDALEVKSRKERGTGEWWWSLP